MNESGKECLLLVDDEKHLLISLRDYLVYEKFDVVVAQSGEDALSQLEKGVKPDLIILDISMPGIGGLGFLRQIAGADGKPKYPVLVLTARSKMEEFFTTVNVDGFLAKPCEEGKLIRKIREILAAHQTLPERRGRTTRKILFAEDERESIQTMTVLLETAGFDVEVVTNGPEVLEKAPTLVPDLVLMKEILPRLNGSAVASLIGVMPSLAKVPVIIYDETLSENEALPVRYGNIKCVRKVLRSRDPGGILKAIDEVLTR